MPLISAPQLTRFVEEILRAADVPAHKASVTAESLIASNLRGVDSHGVQLLPFYIDQLLAGEMDPAADGRVISESGCLPALRRAERHRPVDRRYLLRATPSASPANTAWQW